MIEKTVLVIGVGFMGKMQANLWKNLGYKVTICDVEEVSTVWVTKEGVMCPVEWDRMKIAKDIGVPFVLLPKEWEAQKKALSNLKADVWNISSPTSFHAKQLLLAKKLGVSKVLLEKPVALKESEMKELAHLVDDNSILIQVNYIERANQAYRVVLDYLKNCDWKPKNGLFWRQHDATDYIIAGDAPADHPWGFLRDSSHDVSEMHGINKVIAHQEITALAGEMIPWHAKYPNHPKLHLPSDYKSQVEFGSTSINYMVRGAKDEPREKRFFILYDDHNLLYCSTLPRARIQPCVLYVKGSKNIKKLSRWLIVMIHKKNCLMILSF